MHRILTSHPRLPLVLAAACLASVFAPVLPSPLVPAALAARGVFIGTSSWKYPGWRGLLYEDDRYVWRGRFSESRFGQLCLGEYGEIFKTVCVDAAYYKFPDHDYLRRMADAVPEDFLFGLKVTDEITIRAMWRHYRSLMEAR